MVVVINVNRKCKVKVAGAYAPTSRYKGDAVSSTYKDVRSAMSNLDSQYTVVRGNFNAIVGEEQLSEHAAVNFGIDIQEIAEAVPWLDL